MTNIEIAYIIDGDEIGQSRAKFAPIHHRPICGEFLYVPAYLEEPFSELWADAEYINGYNEWLNDTVDRLEIDEYSFARMKEAEVVKIVHKLNVLVLKLDVSRFEKKRIIGRYYIMTKEELLTLIDDWSYFRDFRKKDNYSFAFPFELDKETLYNIQILSKSYQLWEVEKDTKTGNSPLGAIIRTKIDFVLL